MLRIALACAVAAGLAGCAEKPKEAPAVRAAASTVAPPLPATNAPICAKPPEKAAFDLASLKSELMVTAISCKTEERYNAFIMRFRPDLVGAEKNLTGFFGRAYGRRATQEHDDYITSLANAQSQDGIRAGTEFCTQTGPMFDEVMDLKNGSELTRYASSKPLFQPLTVAECQAPPPPAAKPARTRTTRR
jgi:hypothetical protein